MLLDDVPGPVHIASLDRREGELRYVTQNFNDLQGLKLMPFWAGFLILLFAYSHKHAPVLGVLMAFVAVIALTFAWASFLSRWYKERHGFIGAKLVQREQVRGASLAWWALAILNMGLLFSPRTLAANSTFDVITFFFLLPKCLLAPPRSGAIRLRQALYIVATLAGLGVWVYAAVCPRALQTWIWLWSMLLLGLYDHWLLGYLLGPRRFKIAESSHE